MNSNLKYISRVARFIVFALKTKDNKFLNLSTSIEVIDESKKDYEVFPPNHDGILSGMKNLKTKRN